MASLIDQCAIVDDYKLSLVSLSRVSKDTLEKSVTNVKKMMEAHNFQNPEDYGKWIVKLYSEYMIYRDLQTVHNYVSKHL